MLVGTGLSTFNRGALGEVGIHLADPFVLGA